MAENDTTTTTDAESEQKPELVPPVAGAPDNAGGNAGDSNADGDNNVGDSVENNAPESTGDNARANANGGGGCGGGGPAAAADAPQDDGIARPSGVKMVLMNISLCLAVFLVALDQTIIAPALGAITGEFGSVRDIGWYGSAYLLTATALQPTYGALYRMFSAKRTFLAAVALFELGSVVCAAAPSSRAFVVGRALAGVGTAGLFSGGIVILSHTLPLRLRPAAFGLIGAMFGVASVAGPLLGGLFTDRLTWRWCFYINLPVGAVAMLVIVLVLNIDQKKLRRDGGDGDGNGDGEGRSALVRMLLRLDLPGTAVLVPSIVCLLLALQWGGTEYAWDSSVVVGLFVGFAVLIAIFAGIQVWQGDKGSLPPRLFRQRDVVAAMAFAFFFGAGFFPLVFYLCK